MWWKAVISMAVGAGAGGAYAAWAKSMNTG
jgi:hypothetical protein